MMARRLLLEDFATDAPAQRGGAAQMAGGFSEAQRLDAYEQGYSAGWEDAVKAAADDTGHIAAGLATSLQDLSFTYQEAHTHVLSSVKPILMQVLSKVLPAAAHAALPDLVGERLAALQSRAASTPMLLQVSAADEARVAAALPKDPGFPLELRVESTLAEGQVFLSAGTLEEEIDTKEAIEEIVTAISDFFTASQDHAQLQERQAANG
jgi:flagellar assembly protein FliH